jgi:hypothetical protein
MKPKIFLIIAIFSCLINFAQQFNIGVGSDFKILLFGTENEFTSHGARFNFTTKFEHITETGNYVSFGYTNTDLDVDYQAWYFSGGRQLKLLDKATFIPQFEIGQIIRNGPGVAYDVAPLFIAANAAFRYNIVANVIIEFALNLQLSRDLPDRTFRYGGLLSIYQPIF